MFDLKNLPETIDGVAQREALQRSGKADADYYLGWTYQTDGSSADQAFYDAMIANMADPGALAEQPLRYAVAVSRTTLHTFPSDEQILDEVGRKFKRIVTVENGVRKGGLGSAVLEWMNDHGYQPEVIRLGLPDQFVEHGKVSELNKIVGLDPESIKAAIIGNHNS